MTHRVRVALALLLFAGISAGHAQDGDYGDWTNRDQNTVDAMVEDLKVLIEKAERANAAHPRFLKDLQELVDRYDNPWPLALVREDFGDGEYHRDPAWRVMRGEFFIDWSGGLRTEVGTSTKVVAKQSGAKKKVTGKDVAAAIIGGLLGFPGQEKPAPKDPDEKRDFAEILLPGAVPDAFALTATVTATGAGDGAGDGDNSEWGGLDFGLYQGSGRANSYRLSYTPATGFALVRIRGQDAALIARGEEPVTLADGRDHVIEWRRAPGGLFSVSLDGRALFSVRDTGIEGGFSGFQLVNRGGAFILRSLEIDGAR